jgi:hypothetical protein
MSSKLIAVMGLIFLFGVLGEQHGLAAIYKYTDKNGLITFADDLQSVPEEYRASVKIVSGEASEKSPSRPASAGQPAGPAGPVTGDQAGAALTQKTPGTPVVSGSFGGKALVSAIVAVSSMFLFVILGIFDADHKKAVKVARLAILWGLSVYLLYAHAGDAVRLVRGIGGGIDSARQQSEEKGKKAAQAVKTLNAITEQASQASTEPAQAEKKE